MVVVDKRKKRNGRRVRERLGVVGIGFCVESCFEKRKRKKVKMEWNGRRGQLVLKKWESE